MKVLITGNLGYVGSELTQYFLKKNKNIEIIGCDLNLYSKTYVKKKNSKIRKQIIKDYRDLNNNDLKGVSAIIHLAAMSNDPLGNLIAKETMAVNYLGVKTLIKLAKKNNIKKFIFASSCSVYGSGGNLIKTESDKTKPLTIYAKSKIYSEKFLKKQRDIQVYCLRFGTACGFSNQLRLDLVLNEFVFTAMKYKKIKILSNGLSYRPMIHVIDMSKAIYKCLQSTQKKMFNLFNVGISNFQVLQMAKNVSNLYKCKVMINNKANPDKRSYQVSFQKFNDFAQSYKPSINIKQIIKDLSKNYKSNKLLDLKNYSKSKFIRLVTVQKLIQKNQLNLKL